MKLTPVLAAVWMAACSVEESTSVETSNLHGAGVLDDAGSSAANAVVFVRPILGTQSWNCTGILITPQIVLTANHCFTGFAPAGDCHATATSAEIIVGSSIIDSKTNSGCTNGIPVGVDGVRVCNPVYSSAAVLLRSGTVNCQNDAASDVAIVYLQEAVTPASLAAKTKGSIAIPPAPKIFPPDFLSPHGAMYGVAGYAGKNTRRYKEFYSDDIDHGTQDDNSYWEIKRGDWDIDKGDSGGPLFTINPDLTRNVIGLLSGWKEGAASTYMRWADITRSGNDDFIRGNITNESVPAGLRPSDAWLAAHGKTRQSWWGQTDYSGPQDFAHDPDGDGWIGGHDNCAGLANDQRNSDGDNLGDACDPTPFGPQDPDGDGIPNGYPGAPDWYKADNCPMIKNPDQANCNLDAERAERTRFPDTEILGDACDPVPCPAVRLQLGAAPPPNATSGDKTVGGWIAGRLTRNRLLVNRVSPHTRNGAGGGNPYPVLVSSIETGARFCQKNIALGFDCRAPANMSDAEFEYAPSPDSEVYDPLHPWHRISIDLNYNSWTWNYDNTEALQNWSYFSDNFMWQYMGLIPPAEGRYATTCALPEVGEGTCLDGTLWYHAKTEIGRTLSMVRRIPVGLHGNGAGGGANNMANSYFDVRPDEAYKLFYPGKAPMRQLYLRIPDDEPPPNEDVFRARVRPLFGEELTAPAHIIDDDGSAREAGEHVSEWMQGNFNYPYFAWLSAAEPPGVATRFDDKIVGVAVDIYGTFVSEGVVMDGSRLRAIQEFGDNSFNSVADSNAPAPRQSWIGTFSRSLGGVFVIGGTDLWTGEQLHDIHLWRPGVGWQRLDVFGIEKPVAAVFSPVDQRLWLLHEQANGRTRLVRIDPLTGFAESVGAWMRGTVFDGHRLDLDRNGNVLLTASSSTLRRSQVASLALSNGAAVARLIDRDVPYTTLMPLVDQYEYGFIGVDDTGAVTAIRRKSVLSSGQGSLDEMFR